MRKFVIKATLALVLLCGVTGSPWAHALAAQSPKPLTGSIGPGAFGPPAPTAVPIGGLATRPLTSGANVGVRAGGSELQGGRTRGDGGYRWGYGRSSVNVDEMQYGQRGVMVYDTPTWSYNGTNGWLPSTAKPQWVRDTTLSQLDAWRDLIVTDSICHVDGVCYARQQRVRAPWIARCGCYAFFDGWNRLWRVE